MIGQQPRQLGSGALRAIVLVTAMVAPVASLAAAPRPTEVKTNTAEADRALEWKNREHSAQGEVAARCATGAAPAARESSLRDWLRKAVESDFALRKALVQFLRKDQKKSSTPAQTHSPCEIALRELIGQFKDSIDKGNYESSKQALRPYVLLAVVTGMPEGAELLGKLLIADNSGDWLVSLRSFDADVYAQVLESVAMKVATKLRQDLDLGLIDPSMYGQIKSNVFVEKRVRYNNPLLIHSYLASLVERDVRAKDKNRSGEKRQKFPDESVWASLNILYATMGIQDKTNATSLLVNFVKAHDSAWISSFRKEPVWVQFRLLSIAKSVGGSEVVRELMWLSENSIDDQIKILATSTLDEIIKVDPAKPQSEAQSSEAQRNDAQKTEVQRPAAARGALSR
jgi:hypothetical protein